MAGDLNQLTIGIPNADTLPVERGWISVCVCVPGRESDAEFLC